MRDADKFFSKIKKIDIEDNIDNCFSIKGFIENNSYDNEQKETYFQKIFCKKSPLLDPLKIIMNTKESKECKKINNEKNDNLTNNNVNNINLTKDNINHNLTDNNKNNLTKDKTNDNNSIEDNTTNSNKSDSGINLPIYLLNESLNKINSNNNASHVEALSIYCNSKLTENNKCPTFPYFYNCVNGISETYYHNITDEIEELNEKNGS